MTARVTTNGRTVCGDCAYRTEVRGATPAPIKLREQKVPGPDQLTLT